MTSAVFRSPVMRWAAVAALATVVSLATAVAPAGASSHVPVSGSGTSWAGIAIDQWSLAVRPRGIVVNYNPDGSAAGRANYIDNQDDYAASDPPFRARFDQLGGTGPEHPSQGYSYIPDAAGGLRLYGWVFSAFMLGSVVGIVAGGREADRRASAPLGKSSQSITSVMRGAVPKTVPATPQSVKPAAR